jgi:hypothetical protein
MGGLGFEVYDDTYFDAQVEGSLRSARVIVPIVTGLVNPRSVIDIGCGCGGWLRAFRENGVETLRGMDLACIDRSKLLIHPSEFGHVDLQQPFEIEGTYDLAVCLEVAEHLSSKSSRNLIHALAALAPIILFSAAIPGQGGTCHINEQWPSYWQTLFLDHGYQRLDPIRPRIWQDGRVEWWYRQNILMYASEEAIANFSFLQAVKNSAQTQLECIHPAILRRLLSVRGMLGELPRATWRRLRGLVT